MNADLKRVRENAIDDSPAPSPKRRMNSHPSPPVESTDDDDGMEDWMKVVEVKRKEAIYRQMLEYRRSSERESKRANELEAQRRVLEASFHAVEVCWTQVVSAIRDLGGREGCNFKEEEVLEPTLDPSLTRPELEKAIHARLPTTKQLVNCFVDLATRNATRPTSTADLQTRCLKLEAEASALRSNSKLLESRISSLTSSRNDAERDLQRAQKALDRERMEHDKAQQEWRQDIADRRDTGTPGVRANGSGHATPNGKMDEDMKPSNGAGPSATGMLQDTSELEQLSASRLKQLEELRGEHVQLQQEVDRLKVLANHPSEAAIRESPFFQVYLTQLSTQTNRANAIQARFAATESKLDQVRDANGEFREAVLAEARAECDNLRAQLARKDADLLRVRGGRDDALGNLHIFQAKEAEKTEYTAQLEELAKSRQESNALLVSEVRRLKGKLGAEHGSEGYLSFLAESGIDGDYIKELESRVASSQDQVKALTSQLERVSTDPASAGAETQARAQLEGAWRKIAEYEKVLGPNATAAEDVRLLGEKLEEKEKERAGLALKLAEAEEATNALYTEVEGLSKLWEGLDQAVHNKVFDLRDSEQKVARYVTERAKADNKYFAAMRKNESREAEFKTLERTVEKQTLLLERAREAESGLRAQIAANDKGLTSLKNSALELQTQLATTVSEKTQIELRLQQSQAALSDAQQIAQARVAEALSEKEAKAKLQDEVEGAHRTVKKLKERQEAVAAASSTGISDGEWAITQERNKLLKLLKCSCCEQNFKQQVIAKCYHTFCKHCLDARIASRQRKCPTCGGAFAKEDIQTLYWQ
ncbi:E3 ubiquitin-protein ligase BRE1 [Cryptococcus sp. DSM 104549]